MSADWPIVPLGELTVNLDARRKPVKEPDRKAGPYPYYGASGIVDYVDGYLFDGEHLLIAEDGENLRTRQLPIAFMAKGKFWVNNHAHIVVGNDKADTRYLMYAMQSTDISGYLTGAVMPKLTQGNLNRIPLTCPPLDVQLDIVRILGDLDDKIELNRQINQTLEQIAQTIFKSWFVDFEPVKAKIEAKAAGRDPERAAMYAISGKLESELDQLSPEQRQQLAATTALFPDELVESELGLIPEGWEIGTLADLCLLNAKSWGAKTIPAQVHYVDLANTKNGEISDVQIFSAEDAPSRARRVLRSGDTIIGTVRPGNRSFALIGSSSPVLTGSTGFAVLTPKAEKLRELVFMLATGDSNIDRLTRLADGAAYPAVRPEVVVDEQCIIPPDELSEKFHQVTGPLFDQILANRESFGVLATLRDTLLPKLLSGELSVGSQEVASAGKTAV